MPVTFDLMGKTSMSIENDLALPPLAFEMNGATALQVADQLYAAARSGDRVVIAVSMYDLVHVTRGFEHALARELLDEDGRRIRDQLITMLAPGASYDVYDIEGNLLRSWESTTGIYTAGCRLVTGPDEIWEVVKARHPLGEGRATMIVAPWPEDSARGL